ncbi:MAG: hypothetical protein HGA85_00545 [Nanoarchaeota archaeon]|nr:hypothetical protein [Nanoarchaeota archaeon]
MIIALITSVAILSMFWQPQMDSNYKPAPRYVPTKIERYIANIDRLIGEGHYEIVYDLLSRTKYKREDLPWEHWKAEISETRMRAETLSRKLTDINTLESLLSE